MTSISVPRAYNGWGSTYRVGLGNCWVLEEFPSACMRPDRRIATLSNGRTREPANLGVEVISARDIAYTMAVAGRNAVSASGSRRTSQPLNRDRSQQRAS